MLYSRTFVEQVLVASHRPDKNPWKNKQILDSKMSTHAAASYNNNKTICNHQQVLCHARRLDTPTVYCITEICLISDCRIADNVTQKRPTIRAFIKRFVSVMVLKKNIKMCVCLY